MKVRKRKTKETNRPIFSKKSINEPNELNTSAVEIPMYAPNMGLAPKDYQLSPKLTELEETFEGICKAFLKAANPDMFNSSYMDDGCHYREDYSRSVEVYQGSEM